MPSEVPNPEPPAKSGFPTARVERGGALTVLTRGLRTRMWIVTAVCFIVAGILIVISMRSRGSEITVRFKQGHGIKAGDLLRYRGIDVGEIVTVELAKELGGVQVTIALDPTATDLARAGSRFWIERPRISLARVTGIETFVGSKYIAVLPASRSAPRATAFEGIESPLSILDAEDFEVTIRFRDGFGLEVGDTLKHRGIIVGEVTAVELAQELNGVTVRVRLRESARALARTGSQFWVERPKVSLTSVRGLETLVGGRYLAILPGPEGAAPLTEFDGLDVPPAIDERLEGGLEVILEADQRHGLDAGAPVTYRGMPIGRILSVGLAADAASVEARIYVQPPFKQLLRDNSRFWSTSGIDVTVGLSGIQLNAETLATIAAGGVGFATPNSPGKPVSTGHRFVLSRKPESEWADWRPHLLIGGAFLPDGTQLPQPLRAALRWKEKRFGFERSRQRDGWLLLLDNGQLFGPANMFAPDQHAIPDSPVLEVAGKELPIGGAVRALPGNLAIFQSRDWKAPDSQAWPRDRFRPLVDIDDCLATTGPTGINILLPAARLTASDSGLSIEPSMSIPADAHGATVISTKTGLVVGVLSVEAGRGTVSYVAPADLAKP